MKNAWFRKTRYTLTQLRDNETGKIYDIEVPICMNQPIKFYKPRYNHPTAAKIAWMNLRREDMI